MDSGVTPTHSKKPALVIIVLVLLLLGLVYIYGQNKTTQKKTSTSAEWVDYKATKYGFRFSYLRSWGSPHITEYSVNNGKRYSINFYDNHPDANRPILLVMDTDGVTNGLNKSTVDSKLKSSQPFIKRTNNSYATLSVYPSLHLQSALDIYQSVNLSRVKVSAAHFQYSIIGTYAGCPKNAFIENSNCISESIYSNGSKLITSIDSL